MSAALGENTKANAKPTPLSSPPVLSTATCSTFSCLASNEWQSSPNMGQCSFNHECAGLENDLCAATSERLKTPGQANVTGNQTPHALIWKKKKLHIAIAWPLFREERQAYSQGTIHKQG